MGSRASGNFGHAGRPGLRGGSAPGAGDFTHLTLTHYSQEEREVLQTKYLGTGYSSEELNKGVPHNKHISLYDESKGKPEPFTRGLVKNTVRGKLAILDLASDRGKTFLKKSQGDLSRLNGSIARAGWDGYYNSENRGHIIRLLHDVPTTKGVAIRPREDAETLITKRKLDIQGERIPDRLIGGSSMETKKLGEHTSFDKPVKVVVSGTNGYRSRTAEGVVKIDLNQKGEDILFHRRYPGGRVIVSPYKRKNITSLKIRTSHQNPERNYHL